MEASEKGASGSQISPGTGTLFIRTGTATLCIRTDIGHSFHQNWHWHSFHRNLFMKEVVKATDTFSVSSFNRRG